MGPPIRNRLPGGPVRCARVGPWARGPWPRASFPAWRSFGVPGSRIGGPVGPFCVAAWTCWPVGPCARLAPVYTHTHTQTNTHTFTHCHTHTLTHSHTHTFTHSHTHTLTHTHHSLTHTHSHTHVLTHSHTHTLTHSQMTLFGVHAPVSLN